MFPINITCHALASHRFGLALLVMTISVSLSGGEVTLKDLQAQITAMREAYEGRIASLEGELQKGKTEREVVSRKTQIQHGIDQALGDAERRRITRDEVNQQAISSIINALVWVDRKSVV